ncbi:hypothetical protein PpBr36_01766 [Pyricularia pennisetigena]|uniref:hypothetical protein n=1 Tax=Pyricularia pennisetigena TaxID=1578925 RepID=UPI00114D9379|nr:hypothetical protein PpBr36_01766 [Pyricularia pennisetigena]TLS27850.1 hypothetical protein PpBr36_01766 [Pyricularia pennisetigena]
MPRPLAIPDSSDDEGAVDMDEDVDEGFAALQRSLSHKRREEENNTSPIQKILPFTFAPNIGPLGISDLDSCVALENAAFSPHHRATRDKLEYRLTACPELCLGLYCTVVPSKAKAFDIETLPMAKPVETDRGNGAVSVLLAHIIATGSQSNLITDSDMDYPKDWKTAGFRESKVGHRESSRTVAIHSLAVVPRLQGCGLGKLILKAYLQQINNSGIADRVVLICEDVSFAGLAFYQPEVHLVAYYKRFGFKHIGASKCEFGGGGWHDMVENP